MADEEYEQNGAEYGLYLVAVMTGEATGGAYAGAAVGNARQAGEHCLSLHVAIGIGAILSLVASENQISFLQIPDNEKLSSVKLGENR